MFHVYVIQSTTCGRYYCGFSENVQQRIAQHNDPDYVLSKTTKRFPGPWTLVWKSEPMPERAEAMALERTVKKRGIKRYLDGLRLSR